VYRTVEENKRDEDAVALVDGCGAGAIERVGGGTTAGGRSSPGLPIVTQADVVRTVDVYHALKNRA
jgi:hypothetical protein